jgi:hypothetical protein
MRPVSVEAWQVKAPPLLVLGIFALAVLTLALGNTSGSLFTPDEETFKLVITFAVSVMNVSTVVLMKQYFQSQ